MSNIVNICKILGINIQEQEKNYAEEIPEEIQELLRERKQARQQKDWELSDILRDKIKEKGYIVKDTKEGMNIEKI